MSGEGTGVSVRDMSDVPFRVGVMQLTMEPLDEMLASARVMDEAGMDTVWLAEAYPWWRKNQMEARSSTVVSALMARETIWLTIGWGIISPWTRHPVQVAMDARVVQEAAGPADSCSGSGPRDLPQQHRGPDEEDARADARRGRDRRASCRARPSPTTGTPGAPTYPGCPPKPTRRAACRRCTSPPLRRRCRRSPARSRTAA